ncbi:MAG: haloacid dehalogenase-like hydrolase [Candidatus Edwardsbacteria bacterium]|jgi:phosphoserine phosphatase|nr:haloacid dehalogenase-like hydrolase [Candidatus Edwardsbacteria bacterium]
MKLVLMDVDGTLVRGTSCELLFLPYLARRRLFGPRQLAAFGWFAVRWFLRYGPDVLKADKAYLAGLPQDRVQRAARDFVGEVLPRRFDPAVLARLKDHLAAGDRVVLLTGTPDFIARPLAAALGAHDAIAAVCAARSGAFTAAPPTAHPFGKTKLVLAESYCQKSGLELQYAIAYGDQDDDRHLLERVGRAVAVRPSPGLRALAARRNWQTIE